MWFLVLEAITSADDPRIHAKVIELASCEYGDETERVRAVALLSKVREERALTLLAHLYGSSDSEVQRVAYEALAARDTNRD